MLGLDTATLCQQLLHERLPVQSLEGRPPQSQLLLQLVTTLMKNRETHTRVLQWQPLSLPHTRMRLLMLCLLLLLPIT